MKKPKRYDKRFLPMLWIGLAFWVGSIAIMYILEWAGVEMAGQDNLFDLGKTMFQRLPIFTLLLFCLLQPILEEMSFRLWGVGKKWTLVLCLVLMAMFGVSSIGLLGLLFVVGIILVTVLVKDRFVQVWLNAILSSLLFSLCHISGFGNDVLGMTLGLSDIFGMALVCCWLTVNISFWLSCLLHVLNNSLSIILPLLFLSDVQTGRIIVSYEDSPNMQELATVIEPLRPFADNSALIAGAATQSELAMGAKDFYLVGEPAEIASMIASQRMGIPADVLFDWKAKEESLEERIVLRVNDIKKEVYSCDDLYDHYMSQIACYLDEPLRMDTTEVMLKEIWLVYDDGHEELLTDSCAHFNDVFSRLTTNPYGIRGNEIVMLSEEVNDSTVAFHYYCRLNENALQKEVDKMNAAMDKLKHIDYHLDYRDGRKVTYITIH
ncbi:MAG: CPBP family intramembrane metalloprotease [Bacteroidales bacterium]|nr:CPBP family intramembrane metalloprotease [Bacteroidales bacterium]